MKILLAVDGSPCSDAATQEVAGRLLPPESEVRIISVVEPIIEPMTQGWAMPENYYKEMEDWAENHAKKVVAKAEESLKSPATKDLKLTSTIVEGFPKESIIDEADHWGADLIVVGSHGYRGITRFLIGSVSQAVASHAHCSVEIVRCRQPQSGDKETPKES
jgi:nucleotide-binding universal stress UspA family protein